MTTMGQKTDQERIAELEHDLEVARTERNVALERVETMRHYGRSVEMSSPGPEPGNLLREGSWFAGEDVNLAKQRAAGRAVGVSWSLWHRLGSEEITVTTVEDCEQLIELLGQVQDKIEAVTGCESPMCILPRGHAGAHAGHGEAGGGPVVMIHMQPFVGNVKTTQEQPAASAAAAETLADMLIRERALKDEWFALRDRIRTLL